jgi:mono/diheme cytochrome c family protein
MSLHKRIAIAVSLATAVMVGAVSFSSAEPGQKKSKKSPAPTKAMIDAGKKVYTANGCAACHKIGDQGGATGSDLTKIGKTWKPDKLATVVRDPKKLKKESTMPAYGPDKISDKELKNLVAYLSSLK